MAGALLSWLPLNPRKASALFVGKMNDAYCYGVLLFFFNDDNFIADLYDKNIINENTWKKITSA